MSQIDEVLAAAQLEIGKPYVFGDEGPNTFDCSGLVQWVYAKIGIAAPRIAADQQKWATPVTDPRPGDLVFYHTPATHVGIYIGNGKMIDAPHTGALVRVDDVETATKKPAGYGRPPGLSSIPNPIGWLTGAGADVLSGARHIALEIAAAAGAAALIIGGLWLLARSHLPRGGP